MHHLVQHLTNFVIVDDDPLCVLNTKRAFARVSPLDRLWTATDGAEALALLRGTSMPRERRVVLLDVHMPRMDGISMLRELRADPALQQTTVVMLTTSAEGHDRLDAFGLRVAGYLVKPRRFSTFLAMVATLCRYWATAELP